MSIADVDQEVVLDHSAIAFLCSKQGTCQTDAFDDIVGYPDSAEIAFPVESEEAIFARRGRGTRDNVVVAYFQVVVGLIDPDDASSRIAHEIVMEAARPFGGGFSEAGDQIAVVFSGVEVEEVVIDFDAVSDELNRVGVTHPVVVDVESSAARWDRAAGMLRDRDGAVTDVVVYLYVLVILEWELHREVDLDRIVVDPTAFCLTDLDAVELILLLGLGSGKAVVRDFTVFHPYGEDCSAGNAALDSGYSATLPAASGVDKLTVVDSSGHTERSYTRPQKVLDAQIVQVQVLVRETEDCAV